MKPDNITFSAHAKDKISELSEDSGLLGVGHQWVYGRVKYGHGDLYRMGKGQRYELFCPDNGDIAIQYAVEIDGYRKEATVITVMHVTNPYGRYVQSGKWEPVDA